MNSSDLNIAIVGATGAAGGTALKLLLERGHPSDKITLMASSRSAGRKIPYGDDQIVIAEAASDTFHGVDVALFAAGGLVSRRLAPRAVEQGVFVIDKGSIFRMDPSIPLVVPEVNADDIEWHPGIVSTPNCTSTPFVMVLDALRKLSAIKAVTVATYQSVTGSGSAGQQELIQQSGNVLEGTNTDSSVYPHQIAFNILPHVDDFLPDGYTKEEQKMLNESRKILHDESLAISATCVRVPVEISHSESLQIEFESNVTVNHAKRVLSEYDGVLVVDDPSQNQYPMPIMAAGGDDVLVGRIRKDTAHENGIALWLSCDNLRKGAALNALQIMDEALRRDALNPASQRTSK
ncbi:MAG: aspartate-semialdehyde dehydrogenase [Chloroflexota bacterium]|nr:aspartate-semialdehyde dehydrogenase [Chloroflexota bacterium]MQG37920.1 aspartate-semialdehyde dehydrogenase [SAR202 cluster bacterium]|tara:strand:+ start:4869 stop:5915 length:1047 start_codon:yes stop_codon:yes gene_type:complete